MGMRSLLLLGFATLILVCPTQALTQNGSIGVYADSNATLNAATLVPGEPTTLYIIAKLEGDTSVGLMGAEFRVTGLPDGWIHSSTVNPAANIVLGNPFSFSGGVWRANVVFAECPLMTFVAVCRPVTIIYHNETDMRQDSEITIFVASP